ncbi:hypothetical protein B7C51_07210 [Paenibacillus larvae subsp. pulvifaciens]|uniref:N-acetyltransferase domain-containing protein n=1 Tax=Paenibacillus larvae subsp. pulvifaciens TaxID=1477 RepID=A0A1V0UQW3_9BACL|nr:GNAT family N-acetyltransferase [Paenibacillus larvae]ARF67669.1 hypothetical protein B7C51_07210 [Paenibacillus larvae subsp. pulvifaciens]
MDIQKRNANQDDRWIYRLILEELLPFAQKTNPSLTTGFQEVRSRLNRGITWIAKEGRKACCGFINVVPLKNKRELLVDMLAVDRQYQGSGIGSRLMNVTEAYAHDKKMRRIGLFVDKSNTKAIRFYENKGYTVSDFIPGIECYILYKELGHHEPPLPTRILKRKH